MTATPGRRDPSVPAHITDVRASLHEALDAATELGDLLRAGLAHDDQLRHPAGSPAPAQPDEHGSTR